MLPKRRQELRPPVVLAFAVIAWAYWPSLVEVVERWSTDPQYSHGFLVPLFSAYLLWSRREALGELSPRWWGVGVIALGAAVRVAGYVFYQPWLDAGSLLIVLAGLAASVGGRRVLIWAAPAILFLVFMLPLPYRFQTMFGGSLQQIATAASAYALQTIGISAVAEGNVILLSETRLGVVEACSGLTMLMTFFALATGVAILVQRSWVERVVIFLSAAPIAVMANVVRITTTGLLYESHRDALARAVFHDLAGWLMMPLALVVLIGELYFLSRVLRPVGPQSEARTS
jgi:exosortase